MPTGFQPMSGTSGRVKSALIADDVTTDLLKAVGTETTTTVAEVTLWSLAKKVTTGKVITLESPADSFRVIYPQRLAGGIGDWTAKIEGVVNADATAGAATPLKFPIGSFIKFDLLHHKGSNFGYHACYGRVVSDDTTGSDSTENPQKFSITVEGNGVLPTPGFAA